MAIEVTLDLPIQAPPPPSDQRPVALDLRSRQQQQSPVEPSPRSAFPPRPAGRDTKARKSPPLMPSRDADRSFGRRQPPGKLKVNLVPGSAPLRSLLPVTERKSQEENKLELRPRKVSDGDKNNVAPDGMSAGREGRQFAVANVGNNGRIFLRPTVRPANQRYPQPNFVFPMTPPGTAGLDTLTADKDKDKPAGSLGDSLMSSGQWTPSLIPTPPATANKPRHDGLGTHGQLGRRRAMSDSTIPDASIARESDPGGFKVIITQPGDDYRPKTLEDLNLRNNGPTLNVAIPTWKMGTPRFTIRGTPLIRGSSYAPTEDIRSSSQSTVNRLPPRLESDSSRRPTPSPINIPQLHLDQFGLTSPRSPLVMRPSRTTYFSTKVVIEPRMFDALTFKPTSDDRSIVRISPSTHAVTAGTPPRLVAEITSTRFVDYELVSDFFLTFRSFLEPMDLLKMLVARLRWAVARNDEVGMVVRVRTFVALRHWILNYFMDDFVIEYDLRVMFCTLLNDFVDELSQDLDSRKGQLKILAELKKCWRRVCAQYWDGDLFDTALEPEVPIAPGGIAGHRNGSLDPSFFEAWENGDGPPQLEGFGSQGIHSKEPNSFYIDVSRAGHLDTVVKEERPGTPDNQGIPESVYERRQASPMSMASMDVISCSFPMKHSRFAQTGNPLGAHPVDPSSLYTNMDPIATTPRALTGKRVRAQQAPQVQHKRNNSLTDSLREHSTTMEKMLYKNMEVLMALPYAGSLVRGAMFPPVQAFVDVGASGLGRGQSRQTTVFQPHPLESDKEKASAMSGQGMKKLLGSVRRALSTRGQVISPTQGNFINISPIGPRGATTNRLPGTAIVPQACPKTGSTRPAVRIDLLGAEISEDFKKAVREDAAAEAAKPAFGWPIPKPNEKLDTPELEQEDQLEYSAAHMDSFLGELKPPQFRNFRDTDITTGSKSIVIVDDTAPFGLPAMSGALPAVNSSVEAFAASFMGAGLDPTPPNTPPGQRLGTPRRSSVVLVETTELPLSSIDDPLPSSPMTDAPAHHGVGQLQHQPPPSTAASSRPALSFLNQSPRRPPLSGVRGHVRQHSSRSYRSTRSMGRRRYASFTSGTVPYSTARSFDATTYSEASADYHDDVSDVPVPQPLRVLRRRPGGDLRGATNIGDLDMSPLRRSHSVGSLTTLSDSMRSSYICSPARPESSGFVDVMTSDYSRERVETFSLGAIAEHNPKRQVSLFSTHSSKPVMRPSFEAEAKKLKEIPDDADDDGGVESALLKLEGRFERKMHRLSMDSVGGPTKDLVQSDSSDNTMKREEKRDHRHRHVDEHVVLPRGLSLAQHSEHMSHRLPSLLSVPPLSMSEDGPDRDGQSFLSNASPESYSDVPILERELADNVAVKRATREWTNNSIFRDDDDMSTPREERPELISQHSSYEIIQKTASMEKMNAKQAAGHQRPVTSDSFLDDESDNGSDLSSELSMEFVDDPLQGIVRARSNTIESTLPAHPLAEPQEQPRSLSPLPQPLRANPPSPPMTLVQALRMSPETARIPEVHDHQVWESKPLPPTPETSPTTVPYAHSVHSAEATGTQQAQRSTVGLSEAQDNKLSAHLPFILAFDSEVLAQQFTLIEKDALNEIDWRELIEMRWKNLEHNDVRSWVDFLRNSDARGVEVVVARFNIMVKWAISEVVLTQNMEERARCIIKYIHIAANCRRYRNFATMSQIAIALTSKEVSQLGKTWAMVPPSDLRTLKELEALVSPTRNFHTLRAEMEVVGITTADQGCIPFVGIYTHDLLFNAQKPSEIASSPTTAPLVNFERCRCAASVVKTLLRLLEASTLYTFQPIEGITERCLWMSALSDDDIRRLSESLC